MSQRSSVHESCLNSSDAEFHSPTLRNVMELDSEASQENEYFSQEQTDSLPDVIDDEVIGIITMEDVMEELLQVRMVIYSIVLKMQNTLQILKTFSYQLNNLIHRSLVKCFFIF